MIDKDNSNIYELGELLDYEQPTEYIVKSSKYNDKNKTPVLTAGKTFILGYTDEKEGIFNDKLPVIIFDDFTTAIKFVDFPFKVKSSAMKILYADKEKVNIKYLYYIMLGINFVVRKHKRHWISEYSKIKIQIPSLVDQKRIADKINNLSIQVNNAIEQTKIALENSEKLLRSKSNQFFNESLRNDWKDFSFEEVTDTITDFVANGSFASLKENVKYLKIPDYAILLRTKDYSHNFEGPFIYVNKNAYDFLKKSSLKENDIVACNVGSIDTVFRVPKMEKPMTLGPNAILIKSKYNDYIFSYMLSDLYLERLKKICSKNLQPKFNKTGFRKLQIPFPIRDGKIDFERLQKISIELDKIKEKQNELKQKYLEQLKYFDKLKLSILNQAFQGKL